MKKQLTVSPEKPTPGNILFLYVSKDYRRNGIGTGLLKQISTEKDTDYSIYMDQLGSKNLYGKSWFRKEKRGFPDAGAEQKTLPGKCSSLQKRTALRNTFINYAGDKWKMKKIGIMLTATVAF